MALSKRAAVTAAVRKGRNADGGYTVDVVSDVPAVVTSAHSLIRHTNETLIMATEAKSDEPLNDRTMAELVNQHVIFHSVHYGC